MAYPTGTVTFLFSDIEGSTVRWERDRDAMASALARHDTLLRATLEARGAYVFKTIGDAFCAAFARPQDAIAAALEAQRALGSEDFSAVEGVRVRMALHAGNADERDGDYFGPALNRVARLLAIGHGGQVLVSGTAADLLHGDLPGASSLRDLGAHRLKDLAQPERVYQLVAPDLPDSFPELRSLDTLSNNLPAQLTSFVGRNDAVAEIKELLATHRLVTLSGAGGSGKTRCAIQVAAELLDASPDGVWLVELAPVADAAAIPNAVARALGVQEQPNRPMLDTLLAYLKRKRLLLVLDGCEHVIDEARKLIAAILHACPDARIVATSREGLNVSGEQLYRMPSLSIDDAVHLFADRALAVDKRFALTDAVMPHVVEICRRLDGIPLALELAAARVKVLSPQQLVTKLDERFRVLTGGDRSALPRHQTMRALIDWSYDLLSEDERAIFRKLSIFAGGFTLESASTACANAEIDEISVLDLLSSLVDKSLVHAEPVELGTRYRLLESTRQYAREKLAEAGEFDDAARAQARACLALAEELDDIWESTPDRVCFLRGLPELENFRAAMEWTLAHGNDVEGGQRLAAHLRRPYSPIGLVETARWIRTAQNASVAQTPAEILALLDLAEAQMSVALARYAASAAAAERALPRFLELGDRLRATDALRLVGQSLVFLGAIQRGEEALRQALDGARALGAGKMTCYILASLADARSESNDLPAARAHYAEALKIAQAAGADRWVSLIASNLAETEFRGGNAEEALRVARESLAHFNEFNSKLRGGFTQGNIANYLRTLGRYDEAREAAREAIMSGRDVQQEVTVLFAMQHLASMPGEHERAARLLGYVDGRLAALEATRGYTEVVERDELLATLERDLGGDALAKLTAEGRDWNEDRAVAEAMEM